MQRSASTLARKPVSTEINPARKSVFFQPKLTINQPGDIYEQQADAMAAQVMRMPETNHTQSFFAATSPIQKKCAACESEEEKPIQRKCAHCEEEDILQKKEVTGGSGGMTVPSGVHDVINSGGQKLDAGTKNFMESRFGYDFSNVRIHNDTNAHQSSSAINAKAYTHANHIAFASGQYQPHTNTGKELLAHELTHVIQQNHGGLPIVHRAVDGSSSCTSSAARAAVGAPMIILGLHDLLAGAHLSFAIMSLRLDMMTKSGEPSGDAFDAYRNRFGDPVEVKGKFKDRFDGSSHDSLVEAQISEMNSLIRMLEKVGKVLDKGISYQCMGTSARNFGGVSFSKCAANVDAKASGGLNAIMICPAFWQTSSDQGIIIIHELFHIVFGFGDHDKAPFAQTSKERLTEPQCYAGFVADVNKVTDGDVSCPSVVKP